MPVSGPRKPGPFTATTAGRRSGYPRATRFPSAYHAVAAAMIGAPANPAAKDDCPGADGRRDPVFRARPGLGASDGQAVARACWRRWPRTCAGWKGGLAHAGGAAGSAGGGQGHSGGPDRGPVPTGAPGHRRHHAADSSHDCQQGTVPAERSWAWAATNSAPLTTSRAMGSSSPRTRRAATTAAPGTRTTPRATPIGGPARTPRRSTRTRPATTSRATAATSRPRAVLVRAVWAALVDLGVAGGHSDEARCHPSGDRGRRLLRSTVSAAAG